MFQTKEFILQWWMAFMFAGIGGFLCARIKKRYCDQENIKKGTRALLRSQIIHDYEKYTEKEELPIYARENLTEAYEAYHALKGNGVITDLFEKLNALPLRKEKVNM